MVYLHNGRLLTGASGKLRNKKYDPCKILERINDNALLLILPRTWQYLQHSTWQRL
jgi:hypothetical protein